MIAEGIYEPDDTNNRMESDLRRWMWLVEGVAKKHFVGTCVNSFDGDGDCTVPGLPWSDVSAFAGADADATEIPPESFLSLVELPPKLWRKVSRHKLRYMTTDDGVLMLYDDDADVNYFFV